jgi:sugar phosphate isomerase/epimerase
MAKLRPLAVQSFCLRGFDKNEVVAAKVKECGLSAIEICAKHIDFTKVESFDGHLATYAAAGVAIVSIGVQTFRNDAVNERHFFEFAKKAGGTTLSASFAIDAIPAALKTAEGLSEEFGIPLGIHNHGGRHWLGNAQTLEWIFKQTGPRIGLMLDTAWAMDAGEDPVAMVEKFGPRVVGVHVKDFVYDRARKHRDVVVGTGNLDLAKLFAALRKTGFAGNVILEYEGDVENPVPALKACVDAIRREYPHV